MKKLILIVCLLCVSVSNLFAKDVVERPDDPFHVSAANMAVTVLSEQQANEVLDVLFKYYRNKFDSTRGTFYISLVELGGACLTAGIDLELANKYAMAVLKNAVNNRPDLTKFTKQFSPNWMGVNISFKSSYMELLKGEYCFRGEFVFDGVHFLCNGKDLMNSVDEQGKKELLLLAQGEVELKGRVVDESGEIMHVWGWK